MGRERTPLKREKKGSITINLSNLWRNPDIQDSVVKELNKFKTNKR